MGFSWSAGKAFFTRMGNDNIVLLRDKSRKLAWYACTFTFRSTSLLFSWDTQLAAYMVPPIAVSFWHETIGLEQYEPLDSDSDSDYEVTPQPRRRRKKVRKRKRNDNGDDSEPTAKKRRMANGDAEGTVNTNSIYLILSLNHIKNDNQQKMLLKVIILFN